MGSNRYKRILPWHRRVAIGVDHTTRGRKQPIIHKLLQSGIIMYFASANTLAQGTNSALPSKDVKTNDLQKKISSKHPSLSSRCLRVYALTQWM